MARATPAARACRGNRGRRRIMAVSSRVAHVEGRRCRAQQDTGLTSPPPLSRGMSARLLSQSWLTIVDIDDTATPPRIGAPADPEGRSSTARHCPGVAAGPGGAVGACGGGAGCPGCPARHAAGHADHLDRRRTGPPWGRSRPGQGFLERRVVGHRFAGLLQRPVVSLDDQPRLLLAEVVVAVGRVVVRAPLPDLEPFPVLRGGLGKSPVLYAIVPW